MGWIVTALGWLALAFAVGLELGSRWVASVIPGAGNDPPGFAILALALLDGTLLYSWTTITLGGYLREAIVTPLFKVANLVAFLALTILAIITILVSFALLLLMISLLMAVPFGPLAYLAKFAYFPVGAAQVLLGSIALLKLGFLALLLVGQPRLLADYRKLLILLALSIGCTYLVSFLHVFVPGILASLTDAVGALVVGVLGAGFGLFYLVGAIWGALMLLVDAWRGGRKLARA